MQQALINQSTKSSPNELIIIIHANNKKNHSSKLIYHFSFDEMGYYDIPAFINLILAVTNQEKLFYIGHSQGTTSFYTMASQRPEYNEKIRLMVSLAPIAFMSNTAHPLLKVLVQNKDILYVSFNISKHRMKLKWSFQLLATTLKFYEIFPHWEFITTLGSELCNDDAKTQDLCVSLIEAVAGLNEKELNKVLIANLTLWSFNTMVSCRLWFRYC